MGPEDVLFVGKNLGVVPWYRCGLPAKELGSAWLSLSGRPSNYWLRAALGVSSMPKFEDYKIVILQQVEGEEWAEEIMRLRNLGVIVIYEVDDYLHGVREIGSHGARDIFTEERMADFEMCMEACDAMICSTEWLALSYQEFNENVFVCRNSIEADRYARFSLPPGRRTLNIGWAGGQGHLESAIAWLPAVQKILDEFPETRFISIGLQVANLLREDRALALSFCAMENFPGALCNFDIGIAPAGRDDFFAAKSDLRFLETGALGIPLVADPFVYEDIENGFTGYLADTADEAHRYLRKLVTSKLLRQEIGGHARDYVLNERSMAVGVEQWVKVFETVA